MYAFWRRISYTKGYEAGKKEHSIELKSSRNKIKE